MNSKLTKLQYWTQRVLPQVYDDSLSYYELLNKVVSYLNDVIESQNETNDNFAAMVVLYETLKEFVDTYFDELDIQNEINAKLDIMAADGTLDQIINVNIFNDLNEQLAQIAIQVTTYKHLVTDNDWTNAIQTTIDFVANNGGGKVLLTNKTFNYSEDIHLKEGVMLEGHGEGTILNCTSLSGGRIIFYNKSRLKDIKILVPTNYNDDLFYFSNTYLRSVNSVDAIEENCRVLIEGVRVLSDFSQTAEVKTGIKMFATRSDVANAHGAGYAGVIFRDCLFKGFKTIIKIKTELTGWVNGCLFDNVSVRDFETAVNIEKSAESLGIDYNIFTLYIQTRSYTKDIFIDNSGINNNYTGCTVWDMTSHVDAKIGNALLTNVQNGTSIPKERYHWFLRRNSYHLIGRFSGFTTSVQHVMFSVTSHTNYKTDFFIRGTGAGVVERRNYGTDRLHNDIEIYRKNLDNGQVEIYIYNPNNLEVECNVYFESMRSFFPNPYTTYETVLNAVKMTNIIDYYPELPKVTNNTDLIRGNRKKLEFYEDNVLGNILSGQKLEWQFEQETSTSGATHIKVLAMMGTTGASRAMSERSFIFRVDSTNIFDLTSDIRLNTVFDVGDIAIERVVGKNAFNLIIKHPTSITGTWDAWTISLEIVCASNLKSVSRTIKSI